MQNLSKKFFKRTKIVSTFGPAITSDILSLKDLEDPSKKEVVAEVYDRVQKLIESGMNCARLNFSHGTHEEQLVRIKIIRDVAAKLKKNIAIMLDTKGPEIRLGKFNQKKAEVRINTQVDIYTVNDVIGDYNHFSVKATSDWYNMINDVKVGSSILVDDGKLKLVVTNIDKEANIIHTISENSHEISEKKRINLPDANYTMPFLSDKDKEDIKFACDNKLDFIALSFVNSADNVREVREILAQNNFPNIQLISKIETKNAINKLDEIIAASDGIMVARGDLGLEIPYYEVPYWQKQIIRKCRFTGKTSIVATQMLDSLEHNIQPTRAEVTDVFFAVERGADATMLSGETANGEFPVNAVEIMSNIDVKSEILFDYERAIDVYFPKTKFPKYAKRTATRIARNLLPSGEQINPQFKYNALILFSDDKLLVKAISNIRPAATVILVTSEPELLKFYAVHYGIQTYYVDDLNEAKENYKDVAEDALNNIFGSQKSAIAYFNKRFHKI